MGSLYYKKVYVKPTGRRQGELARKAGCSVAHLKEITGAYRNVYVKLTRRRQEELARGAGRNFCAVKEKHGGLLRNCM